MLNQSIFISIFLVFLITSNSYSKILVYSLPELLTAVKESNEKIYMKPGNYNLEDLPSKSRRILISGSKNKITLTGVYIKVPVGCVDRCYIDLAGNDNEIIGGEFVDTYKNGLKKITDFSAYNKDRKNLAFGLRGDPVMRITGNDNVVDGIKLTVRGSFPYGYGSMYGIGADNVFGLNKRCGIQITGVGNTLDRIEVQQRAFGHGIFMQNGADKTVIKNSLVEGRVRKTKDLYEETASYDLPFRANYVMPKNNERAIPKDEVHSLCEDGIRMYRIPGSISIDNCTIKQMRGGIRLYLGGKATVNKVTSINCGLTGYNLPTEGEITESSGNFAYAPLQNFRLNRRDTEVEMTIIPSPHAAGSHNIADIDGDNHKIIFHRSQGPRDTKEKRAIIISGNKSRVTNHTEYAIILESSASGNIIKSAGPVTDNGSKNRVTKIR